MISYQDYVSVSFTNKNGRVRVALDVQEMPLALQLVVRDDGHVYAFCHPRTEPAATPVTNAYVDVAMKVRHDGYVKLHFDVYDECPWKERIRKQAAESFGTARLKRVKARKLGGAPREKKVRYKPVRKSPAKAWNAQKDELYAEFMNALRRERLLPGVRRAMRTYVRDYNVETSASWIPKVQSGREIAAAAAASGIGGESKRQQKLASKKRSSARTVRKPVNVTQVPRSTTEKSASQTVLSAPAVFLTQSERRADARKKRDEQQVLVAKKKQKECYKSIPKHVRERDIKDARDKRSPVLQGGKLLTAGLSVAAGVVLGKLFGVLKKTDGLVSDVHNFVAQFVRKIKDLAATLKGLLGKAMWVVPLVMMVWFIYVKTNFIGPLAAAMTLTALSKVFGKPLWTRISKFFPERDAEEPSLQDGFSSVAPKLLSVLLCFSVFKERKLPMAITEFCKRLAMIDRLSGGWETFIDWVMRALQAFTDMLTKFFSLKRVVFYEKTKDCLSVWMAKVDEKAKLHSTAGVDITPTEINSLVALISEGYGFKELYRRTSMSAMRQIDEYLIKATNILAPHLGSINARNNFRQEPVSVIFQGAPGIGKTVLCVPFCGALLKTGGLVPADATSDDIQKEMWQKGTSEFWNGYSSQQALIMDDAFQARADPSNAENEYMTIIRMIGSWSFPLNFADLSSKGKIYYTSRLVFMTTNISSIVSEAGLVLNEPEAVVRRLTYSYKLHLKPQFAINGRLDKVRFDEERRRCAAEHTGLDRFPWHIWEVSKHDFSSGRTTEERIPLRNLLDEISVELRRRTSSFQDERTAAADFFDGLVPDIVTQAGKYVNNVSSWSDEIFESSTFKSTLCDVLEDESETRYVKRRDVQAQEASGMPFLNFVKEMKDVHGWIKFAMGAGTIVVVSMLVLHAVKALLRGFWSFTKSLFGCKSRRKVREQSNRPLTTKVIRGPRVTLQSTDNRVAENAYANTYKVSFTTDRQSDHILGQIMFVCDRLAVQPQHFSESVVRMLADHTITLETVMRFRHVRTSSELSCSVGAYLKMRRASYEDRDVEFIEFSASIRAHRNIISNFIREGDLRYVSGARVRLDVCEIDDGRKITTNQRQKVFVVPSVYIGKDLKFGGRKMTRYFQYSAATVSGDCGGVLCLFDHSSYSGRAIMGLHCAGYEGAGHEVGYANVITQENIQAAVADLEIVYDNFEEDLKDRGISFQSGNVLPFDEAGSFLPLGYVEKPVNLSPVTSYYPVKGLYGLLGEYDCAPAPLGPVYRDGELKYPMLNAVAPYSTPVYYYEHSWMEQAMHVALRPLFALTKESGRSIYTFEEAVKGIPQEKFRSIPRGTSAGYPYIYDVSRGKKEFFGDEGEYRLDTPLARQMSARVDYILEQAKKNIRCGFVFVDFLKDEIRPADKVRDVKTRLISSAPMDYVIAFRRMFGAFSAAAMRMHTRSGMAPGICTYTDWPFLVQVLSKHGKKVFDGDFKSFDASEQPCIHDLILNAINRWYDDGEENARVRKVLWLELVHSRHIGGKGNDQRHIYQWNKSLPSGHPFTTIVNSIYSLFLLVATYIHKTGDHVGFWDSVSPVTYGDDNVVNVEDNVSNVYNQVTVAQSMKELFGVVYTPGRKDGVWTPVGALEDISFLKRGFRCEGNRWLCPLELDSFLYTFYFCKNRRLESDIIADNLEIALQELSMHDESRWDEFAGQLFEIQGARRLSPRVLPTREGYQRYVLTRSDSWY